MNSEGLRFIGLAVCLVCWMQHIAASAVTGQFVWLIVGALVAPAGVINGGLILLGII